MANEGISFDEAFGGQVPPAQPPKSDGKGISFDEAFAAPAPVAHAAGPKYTPGLAEDEDDFPTKAKVAAGEAIASTVSGGVAMLAGGLSNVGQMGADALIPKDIKRPESGELFEKTTEALTYKPRTELGKTQAEAVGKGFSYLGQKEGQLWGEAVMEAPENLKQVSKPADIKPRGFWDYLAYSAEAGRQQTLAGGQAIAGSPAAAAVGETVFNIPQFLLGEMAKLKTSPGAAEVLHDPKGQAAFDEYALKNPGGATELKDHVAQADPELGKSLEVKLQQVGVDARTGKPRVRSVSVEAKREVGRRAAESELGEAERSQGKEETGVTAAAPLGANIDRLRDGSNRQRRNTSDAPTAEESHRALIEPWQQVHEKSEDFYTKLEKDHRDQNKPIGVHELIDHIATNTDNKILGSLLKKVKDHVDNVPVLIKSEVILSDGRRAGGRYHSGEHNIEVMFDKNPFGVTRTSKMLRTIVHEAVHAATVKFLHENGNHPITQEFYQLLDVARERAHTMDRFKGLDSASPNSYTNHYGLSNIFEFASEAISNPTFQKFLVESEEFKLSREKKLGSIVNRIAGLVQKVFGIKDPKEAQLLHNVLQSIEAQMAEQKKSVSGKGQQAPVAKVSAGMADTMREMHGAKLLDPHDPEAMWEEQGKITTRPQIDRALMMGRRAWRKIPGVAVAEGKLAVWSEDLIKRFAPEALGPAAKAAAARIAEVISRQVHADAVFRNAEASKTRRALWNKRPDFVRPFMKFYEMGAKFKDPLFQKVAAEYHAWAERLEAIDREHGADYEAVDHYMPHLFEDPEGLAEHLTKKYGTGWTKPGFMKNRQFNMYEEAIEAGFKPKYDNIEDIFLARQHASDVAVLKDDMLRDLEKYGFAQEKVKGEEPPSWAGDTWTSPYGKKYWVHGHADLILRKAFKQNSLWNAPGLGGSLFRGAMFLKNNYVPVKLSFSLYHPVHVLTIDNVNYLKNTFREVLSGTKNPLSLFGAILKAGAYADKGVPFKAIFDNPRRGGRMRRVFQGKLNAENLTPLEKENLQYIFEGGLVPGLDETYKTGAWENLRSSVQRAVGSFQRGNVGTGAMQAAGVAFKTPFAMISLLQKPMFEVWIPNLKVAGYLADVRSALKADPSLLGDAAKRQQRFRQIAKSTDNRYGEMQYNTLFWDRWAKDIAVLNTLSLGWQLGFLREYGGGMMDLGHTLTKTGDVATKAKAGMLDRPLFTMAYSTQALLYGGILTYALSKTAPQSLMDYIYPRTGNKNPDGSDERLSTPFFTREPMMLAKHIEYEGLGSGLGHLASSKASGIFGMTSQFFTGINSMGQEIFDPQAPAYKQLEQKVAATLADLEPISASNVGLTGRDVAQGDFGKLTSAKAAESFLGFGKAPSYITKSPTVARIDELFNKYYAQKVTPYAQAQESKEFQEAKRLYAAGEEDRAEDLVGEIAERNELSGKERGNLLKSLQGRTDPLAKKFQRLRPEHQKEVLDKATPEEREELLRHAHPRLRREYEEPQE